MTGDVENIGLLFALLVVLFLSWLPGASVFPVPFKEGVQ